jgi:hypothetical protein
VLDFLAAMGVKRSPQQLRRAAVLSHEADVRAQVMQRDGSTCWGCGTDRSPTFQHCDPRGMGGTSERITAAHGIVLCGSGTTGCHGKTENEGRHELFDAGDGQQGWAYLLGWLIRTSAGIEPRDVLRWHHADRCWYELTDGGIRVVRAGVPFRPPPRDLLDRLDALLLARRR